MIKCDTYYDVTCHICSRSMSTDFGLGMAPSQKEARLWAKDLGFINDKGRNICPDCVKRLNIKTDTKPHIPKGTMLSIKDLI